jgi:hypothetical protein
LIVKGVIVPICNTREPFPRVVSIRFPLRSGASPLDFSMTGFNKVKLPASALLSNSFDGPKDVRAAWWDTLWRIPIRSFVVTCSLTWPTILMYTHHLLTLNVSTLASTTWHSCAAMGALTTVGGYYRRYSFGASSMQNSIFNCIAHVLAIHCS